MAQWKETPEPYVKVYEKVKTAALNPKAGDSLIIGCPIISDAGPSVPTLISSQSEFLATYASRDLTKDYIKSLNSLYKGDISDMAETMWLNAYRLAGSCSLLVVRASKSNDVFFAKSLERGDLGTYLLRDGQLLKLVQDFKIVVDYDKEKAVHSSDGWSINVNGVGVVGNRSTDDGAQYDYYVKDLRELVEYLNDTPGFFSPSYTFYSDERGTVACGDTETPVSVVFNEVYLGPGFLDTTDTRCPGGLSYVVTCEPDWTSSNPTQKVVDLNGTAFSSFSASPYYATNAYNSSTDLKVRIRRFNHDAVLSNENTPDAFAKGVSSYTVLGNVLDTFCHDKSGNRKTPAESVLERDFYEVAVMDPSISGEPVCFNIGNILGRGDMTVAAVNESLKMIQLQLPEDMTELGLDYYGYLPKSKTSGWAIRTEALKTTDTFTAYETESAMRKVTGTVGAYAVVGRKEALYYKYVGGTWTVMQDSEVSAKPAVNYEESSLSTLKAHVLKPGEGDIAKIGSDVAGTCYEWKTGLTLKDIDPEELYVDLNIDPSEYSILDVSDSDILKALDQISLDEVYITEGLTDLGCTSPMVQSYMANMAINDNYFYPFSTVKSTNYLSIANSAARMSQDHFKLFTCAPWDVDTGTVGWKYYTAPSTLYWESVSRNRKLGREFAPLFGQVNGVAQYQKPLVEFNKKTRQLLLSKKINTVLYNIQSSTYNWNDNYTKQSEDTIMSDEANSRLMIRISKAIPVLLRQYIGRRIGEILWKDMTTTLSFWFNSSIVPMEYGIDNYRVIIDSSNNSDADARANRVNVKVDVRYNRALKYIEVYNDAYDVGQTFE